MITIALILVIIASSLLLHKQSYKSNNEFADPEKSEYTDTIRFVVEPDSLSNSDTIVGRTKKKRTGRKPAKKLKQKNRPTPRNHRDEIVS